VRCMPGALWSLHEQTAGLCSNCGIVCLQMPLAAWYKFTSEQLGGEALVGKRVCVDWGEHNSQTDEDRCGPTQVHLCKKRESAGEHRHTGV
jgi:hypothetical protein